MCELTNRMTDQKDVDEEVNIAAPLEEDTEWWEKDGKAKGRKCYQRWRCNRKTARART